MNPSFTGYRPAAFTFLRALARNNRREWFEAHRDDYVHQVAEPTRALIEELDVRFATLAPEFVGDPKRSMFRIHRDVRFSKDKAPYKTHASLWIFHRAPGRGVGKEIDGGAGFYLHLQPGASMVAGGLWMPPAHALAKIRDRLGTDLPGWRRAVTAAPFTRRFGTLTQDEPGILLKRLPRGFTDDHPAASWLRYKSFTVGVGYADRDLQSAALVDLAMRDFALMLPMARWLNRALGYLPASTR